MSDDYEEVPGDCPHFPGYELGKSQCLLCKPKPVVPRVQLTTPAAPGVFRHHVGSVVDRPERGASWIHEECGSIKDDPRSVEAQYAGHCGSCDERIEEGDMIVPDAPL